MLVAMSHTPQQIARRIDHTLLKAEATLAQVDKVCDEAVKHQFASVCVNPMFVSHVHNRLRNTGVKTCAVAGFPLGASTASIKAHEAAQSVNHGAEEIDVVAHLPHLLAGDEERIKAELAEVVWRVREARKDVVIKVIVESSLLMHEVDAKTAEQRIETACRAVRSAGADFIKTSTGFHATGGATVEAVRLMRKHAGSLKVKASGGIRNHDDAVKMLEAGADRLGCSAGVAIVTGGVAKAGY
jgi:deoxyribose-phosphate aldolase